MKLKFILLVLFVFSLESRAVLNIGDMVPDFCWSDVEQNGVCLYDVTNKVRILIFNAGWCGPCNSEMQELAPQSQEFKGMPVAFLSLSVDGWSQGSGVTPQFLQEWKAKHNIPFHVLKAGSGDMREFFEPPYYIPSIAIVDQFGKLAYREVMPPISTLFAKIREILGEGLPVPIPLPYPLP